MRAPPATYPSQHAASYLVNSTSGDEEAALYAARASQVFTAMQRRYSTGDAGYRRDGRLRGLRSAAHLWPFVRAFVAALDLAGIPDGLIRGFDAGRVIGQRLDTLERYWDCTGEPPAYRSDVLGARLGGDRYYDDNAWVGLALVQLERMRPGNGRLERAAQLFHFATTGWDRREGVPSPGGVFWVQQGSGAGKRNHDRNTVSNAPNAELGLHLAELTGQSGCAQGLIGPRSMYRWVNATLDAGADLEVPATGLYWDKLRGDGTLDKALWSYNQGSMVATNVLLSRLDGDAQAPYLARAETIARRALARYRGRYEQQPPAFNAIFFRNLLLLHAETADAELRAQIQAAMRGYADRLWAKRRGRFSFLGARGSLLDQSAAVQVLALLAWDRTRYRNLA